MKLKLDENVVVRNFFQLLESMWWIAISVLLLATGALGSESAQKLDLQLLLSDATAMEKLVVEYRPDMNKVLFVYGTGRVVEQAHSLYAPNALVPTCTGKIGQGEVKDLVGEMIRHRFFELPIRSFWFATASDDYADFLKELKLHSIVIDDGTHRASRYFAEGVFNDKKEFIPPDFSAIEEVLQQIAKSALGNTPCTISPGIQLPPVTSPGLLPYCAKSGRLARGRLLE